MNIQKNLIITSFIAYASCIVQRCYHMEYTEGKIGKEIPDANPSLQNKFCNRTYNVLKVNFPPYSSRDVLTPRLRACCGDHVRVVAGKTVESYTELTPSLMNSSDFIVPVSGSISKQTSYGYYFIPVVTAPDYFYITPKSDPVFIRLMKSISNALPLVIICILMAILSGFVTWILETWNNKEEFPRMFLIGWFEGFWWSFISMTTVGYGDKTPRSTAGRIFAAIWILIGITMFSILTGLLTNAILSVNEPPNPEMKKAEIGVLMNRLRDQSLIAMYDGIIRQSEETQYWNDVFALANKLHYGHFDGLVIDKIAYKSIKDVLKDFISKYKNEEIYKVWVDDAEYFLYDTLLTPKNYIGEKLAYGILVKDKDVYEYFHDAIASNRHLYLSTVIRDDKKHNIKPESTVDILSFESETFVLAVAVMCGITLALGLFGILYKPLHGKCAFRHATLSPASPIEYPMSDRYSS